MFLGRQHPGHWPRQLHCFSWGWVSGQSEVMQNLETKTWEQNNDGNECTVVWGWFPWPPSSSFPVFAFIPLLPNLLFFPYCSLSPCLNSLPHPLLSSPCCLCCSRVFVLAVMHWHVLTLAKLGQGTFPAESQDMFQDRLKVFLLTAKRAGSIPQNTPWFMVPLLSWCLTNPIGALIHSGSLTGTFQVLAWSHGLLEPHLSL